MSPSPRFRQLTSRLADLRLRLLPRQFDPLGRYSDRQRERARGYTLIAHAELESYLEDMAISYAGRRSTDLAIAGSGAVTLSRQHSETVVADIGLTMGVLVGSQKAVIAYAGTFNHGVKAENIRRLFSPLGLDIAAEFPALVLSLSTWGKTRGALAHSGGFVPLINPQDEYQTVRGFLPDLRRLDQLLSR